MRPAALAGRSLWKPLLLVAILAGCAEPAPASPETELSACPTTPLGEEVCRSEDLAAPASQDRPRPADGWKCARQWAGDAGIAELYMTPQGRLGFYWDWERWKDDGLAFQRLALYFDFEEGESHHIAYSPRGFYAMPGAQSADSRVEIHETFRILRVHAHIDGQWVQDPDNVTFLLDSVGGDSWFATRFDWPGGPYFVDTMHEDVEEGQFGKWSGGGWRGTIAGTEVIIDAATQGIKYTNVDLATMWASPDACAAPLDQL